MCTSSWSSPRAVLHSPAELVKPSPRACPCAGPAGPRWPSRLPARRSVVRRPHRGAARLHRVALVAARPTEVRRVVGVRDVGESERVCIDAEVVEQLAAARAADAALAHLTLVHREQLLRS